LRIALVVHDYYRHGGHARYTAELASRLRRDHDVHVFSNTVDDPDTGGITFLNAGHPPSVRFLSVTLSHPRKDTLATDETPSHPHRFGKLTGYFFGGSSPRLQ